MTQEERIRLAEAVRQACVAAVVEALEDAGVRGPCAEGRLEAALEAMKKLDVTALAAAC